MNKPLLAMAVAAALPALANAQTNVTLSGIYKTGVAQTKYSNGTADADSSLAGVQFNNGNHTALSDGSSRFIIGGSEDLGGGLKAIFQIDNRFKGDDGTQSLAGGNTFVGLAGGFGTIRLGKLDVYHNIGLDEFQSRATAHQASNEGILAYVGDNSSTNAIARGSRSQNVVRYDIPRIAGLRGGLAWSPGARTTEGNPGAAQKGDAWSADLAWASGAITLGGAYWDEKYEGYKLAAPGDSTGQQAWRLYGSYDFGMFKLGLTYDESQLKYTGTGDRKRGAWSIPVSAKIGTGTLLFTYTQADDIKVGGSKSNDTGAKMFALGYDYPFSKRTSVGVSYAVINNDSGARYGYYTSGAGNLPAPTPGQDSKQLYVGLRHAF